MKGRTVCTKFVLALGCFRIVSKKLTDQCEDCSLKKKRTRRERLKSALYIRLKKRKRLFLKKKFEIFEVFSFRKFRIVPKIVKGGPFGIFCCKISKKLERGTLLNIKKFSKKVAQCRKKSNGRTL